jgi:hypothetical protein
MSNWKTDFDSKLNELVPEIAPVSEDITKGLKLPVRYDPQAQAIRETDFGSVLVELPRSFAVTKEGESRLRETANQRGEYIAKCINEHESLESRLLEYERLMQQAYRIELTDYERVLEKSGSLESPTGIVWTVETEDERRLSSHYSVLEAFEAATKV